MFAFALTSECRPSKICTKVSKKLTKYVFACYLDKAIILHLVKKQYFVGFLFSPGSAQTDFG